MCWGQITLKGLLCSFLPSVDFNLVNRSIMNVSSRSHLKRLGMLIWPFSECGDNGISRDLFFRKLLPAAGLWWIIWQLKSWHQYPVLPSTVIVCHLSFPLFSTRCYRTCMKSYSLLPIAEGSEQIRLLSPPFFFIFLSFLEDLCLHYPFVTATFRKSPCRLLGYAFMMPSLFLSILSLFCPSGFKIRYMLLSVCIKTSIRVIKHVQIFCGTIFGIFFKLQ